EVRLKFADRMRPAAVEPRSAAPAANAPASQASPASPDAAFPAGGGEQIATAAPRDRLQRMWRVPSSRALLREGRIVRVKEQNPDLARTLGMSEAEGKDLIAFLADQELRRQL